MPKEWTKASLGATIYHSVFKATTTERQVRELCAEAKANGFAGVCVNPIWVAACAKELQGSKPLVSAVVGFPLGATASAVKAIETQLAVKQGAREIDMVMDLGAAKSGDWKAVEEDIREVVKAAGPALLSVIIETCYLTDAEKVKACEAAVGAGARYVETSTGFGPGGATPEDVRLIREAVAGRLLVKATGGVRTYHDAIALLDAGADRIGASSGVAIIMELPE